MIKLNNKGMTLVEIIVTFFLLLLIIIGLYNLILDVKTTLKNKEIVKGITDYSSLKNDEIAYDLITNKPFSFVIKKTSNDKFICNSNNYCKAGTSSISINYKNKIREIGVGSLNADYCKNITPCLVYFYSNKGEIGTVTIALKGKSNDNLAGILYGKEKEVSLQKLPYINEVIMHSDSKDKNKNIYIDSKNNMLIINYPYFLKDQINYGFKIVHPFLEE